MTADRLTPGAGVHVALYVPERDRIECRAAHVLAVARDGRDLPLIGLLRVLMETPRNAPAGAADMEIWAEPEVPGGPQQIGSVPVLDHRYEAPEVDRTDPGVILPCSVCGIADGHDREVPVYAARWHFPDRSCWSGHRFGR